MKKHVWKIDLILILITVGVLMALVGYTRPLVIAPFDDYESMSGEVLFDFERADVLLIDDNMEFSTPNEYAVKEGLRVNLDPGVYYWKVVGIGSSEVRTLTIKSKVELKVVETEEGYEVVNDGNVRLNVDVYDGEELVERKKLDVGDESEVGSGKSEVKIIGEQYG